MKASFFFRAADGIRGLTVTGVQTCALPILPSVTLPAPQSDPIAWLKPLRSSVEQSQTDTELFRPNTFAARSEERRVGEECGCRWAGAHGNNGAATALAPRCDATASGTSTVQ